MSEWLKEHAWKACVGETLPWVRIPLSPPHFCSLALASCDGSSGLQPRRGVLRSPRTGSNPTRWSRRDTLSRVASKTESFPINYCLVPVAVLFIRIERDARLDVAVQIRAVQSHRLDRACEMTVGELNPTTSRNAIPPPSALSRVYMAGDPLVHGSNRSILLGVASGSRARR